MRYAGFVVLAAAVAYGLGASGAVSPLVDQALAWAVKHGASYLAVLVS